MAIRSLQYRGIIIQKADFKKGLIVGKNENTGKTFTKEIRFGKHKDPYFVYQGRRIYLDTFEPFVG